MAASDKQYSSIFSSFFTKVVPVTVEWEGKKVDFYVRELSASKVFELQAAQKKNGGDAEAFTLALISESLCDHDGNRVAPDIEAARKLSQQVHVQAFNKIAQSVAEAVGLTLEKKKENGAAGTAEITAEPAGNV